MQINQSIINFTSYNSRIRSHFWLAAALRPLSINDEHKCEPRDILRL